jgi:hypothetical protein
VKFIGLKKAIIYLFLFAHASLNGPCYSIVYCNGRFVSTGDVEELNYVHMEQYDYRNSGHYPSSCLLFKTHLNSLALSVPRRKHITPPLRAQQVNAIYRFVTMVY